MKYPEGTVLKLTVMRRPVYAHHGYVEAERETTKTAIVRGYTSSGDVLLRIKGLKPGRASFRGRLHGSRRNPAIIYNSAPSRPTKYEVLDVQVVKPKANARKRAKNNPSEPYTLYANPYDISASGWYFHDAEDFDRKFKKHLPVEEYEIEWIDGPEEDRQLFEALDVNQANLAQYFELIDELNDHDKAALYYLLRHRGMGPGEDLDDLLQMVEDEVRVMEGDSKDYLYNLMDDLGGPGATFSPETIQMYFDYERFGRDLAFDLDADDEDDAYYLEMSDRERGEEYVDSMGGVDQLGKTAEEYIDLDAIVRDMEYNGEITEFDFADKTYTTDYRG